VKVFLVNGSQGWPSKNHPGLTIHPIWSFSITLKYDAESLMVLPPLDESLLDKLLLFWSRREEAP